MARRARTVSTPSPHAAAQLRTTACGVSFLSRVGCLSACTALALGAACSSPRRAHTPPPPALVRDQNRLSVPPGSPLRERLVVAAAACKPVALERAAPATIEADPLLTARISAPLPGRVIAVKVRRGDAVVPGQELVQMESPDLVAAQSDYSKARSARQQAARTVQRQRDLHAHGVGAMRELEQAQTERDLASEELQRATARLTQLGIDPAHAGELLRLRSPIAGRVLDIQVSPGEVHNDATVPLMTIADLSVVWLVAHVQEKDVGEVHPGDAAQVDFAAYPSRTVAGRVDAVADLLEPDTRTVQVRVRLDNPQRAYKPGMFATAHFTGSPHDAVVVPEAALVVDGGSTYVFVETTPWTFTRRKVAARSIGGGEAALAEGLTAGERLVVHDAVILQ